MLDLLKSDIPPMLVQQRIRNCIHKYVSSVVAYQANRGMWDLNEVVGEWEMYVTDPFECAAFPLPVFAPTELAAISDVHAAWLSFTGSTSKSITDEGRAMETWQWRSFVGACRKAELAFAARGTLPEAELLSAEP